MRSINIASAVLAVLPLLTTAAVAGPIAQLEPRSSGQSLTLERPVLGQHTQHVLRRTITITNPAAADYHLMALTRRGSVEPRSGHGGRKLVLGNPRDQRAPSRSSGSRSGKKKPASRTGGKKRPSARTFHTAGHDEAESAEAAQYRSNMAIVHTYSETGRVPSQSQVAPQPQSQPIEAGLTIPLPFGAKIGGKLKLGWLRRRSQQYVLYLYFQLVV